MTRQTVAAVMADMLSGYGVTHVFYLPAVLRTMLREIERRTDIRRIHAHSEAGAVYMADGYARASGRPGVCMAQIVGALNLCAGLRDAHLARAPLLALTGGREAGHRDRWAYQEVDDLPAFAPYTKMNAAVDDPARLPDMLRQAFRMATTGCPGPVHLQLAGNTGQAIETADIDFDGIMEPRYGSVPPHRPAPDPDDLRAVADRISRAHRPVIVAGAGVRASGAGPALVALAEALQIPVATSLNAKDSILDDHPLSVGVVGTYSRRSANEVVSAADLVIFIGTRAGGMTTHFWTVPAEGTPTVQIDIDAGVAGRNYPTDATVIGDARSTLERLAELNMPVPAERAAWVGQARQRVADYKSDMSEPYRSQQVPIRPERLVAELSAAMPDDALVVVDTGHSGMWMGGMFEISAPAQQYIRSAGHLGWAFPAALGAKCGAPDRPVVCFTGDLGFWYHMGEIETAVRCGIRTVTVINNNHSGNQALAGMRRLYDGTLTERSGEMWVQNKTDFAEFARIMGATGFRVERPEDIAPAFRDALAADGPSVIDVASDIEALAPLAWEPAG